MYWVLPAFTMVSFGCPGSPGEEESSASESGETDSEGMTGEEECLPVPQPGLCRDAPLDLDAVAGGEGGFVIEAPIFDISPLGDVNGDGLGDFRLKDFVVFSEPEPDSVPLDPDVLKLRGFQVVSLLDGALKPSAAGDVNGDGLDDLMVSSPTGARSWIVFGKEDVNPVDLDEVSAGLGGYELAGATSNAAARPLGDIDGDGLGDLAVVSENSTEVVVVSGKADGEPLALSDLTPLATISLAARVDAGDLDDDGVVDLAYAEVTDDLPPKVGIISAPDGWTAQPRLHTSVSWSASPGSVPDSTGHFEIRDFNGDGKEDLLVTYAYYASIANWAGRLFPGPLPLGEGAVGESDSWPAGSPFTEAALLDASDEPGVEVVLANYDGVWAGRIAGFAPRLGTFSPEYCSAPWDLFLGSLKNVWLPIDDVDGDGREDLMIADLTEELTIVAIDVCAN